jgi:hypothetical protein
LIWLESYRRKWEHQRVKSIDGKSRFLAFFDECDDHSMEKIDKDFPLFVLALVVVERPVYRDQALVEFNRFKLRYFNHEGINLHSRDIRLATGPFSLCSIPRHAHNSCRS